MKVYEFGKEHTRSFTMFQCAAELWWVFKASAEEMAKDYHVYLFIAVDYSELSVEKAKDYNKTMIATGPILRASSLKRSMTV